MKFGFNCLSVTAPRVIKSLFDAVGGGGDPEPTTGPLAATDFAAGSYTSGGSPATYDGFYRHDPLYATYPALAPTPGVGIGTVTNEGSGLVLTDATPYMADGVVAVIKGIMSVTKGTDNAVTRSTIQLDLFDLPDWMDSWSAEVRIQHANDDADLTYRASFFDYGTAYDETTFSAPNGEVTIAVALTPAGIKLYVNGVGVESQIPLTPNTDRNSLGISLAAVEVGSGAGEAVTIIKSIDYYDPAGITTADLIALSLGESTGGGEEPAIVAPYAADFASSDYSTEGQTATFDDFYAPNTGQAIYLYNTNGAGGLLEPTPGVGLVSFPGGVEMEPAKRALVLDPTYIDPLLASGGLVMAVDATFTNDPTKLDSGVGPVGYESQLNGFLSNDAGYWIQWYIFAENLNTGQDTYTLAITDEQALYQAVPLAVPDDGQFRVAARLETDGTITVSVNGLQVITGVSGNFDAGAGNQPANQAGISTSVSAYNQTAAIIITGTVIKEIAAFETDESLVTLSQSNGNTQADTATILDFQANTYKVNGVVQPSINTFAVSAADNASPIPTEWFGPNGMTPAPTSPDGFDEGLAFKQYLPLYTLLENAGTMVLDFTCPDDADWRIVSYQLIDSYSYYSNGQGAYLYSANWLDFSSGPTNAAQFTEDGLADESVPLGTHLQAGANRLVVRRGTDETLHVSLNGSAVASLTNGVIPTQQLITLTVNRSLGYGSASFQRMTVVKTLMTDAQMITASTPAGGTAWTNNP